jgi:hypothetical protein
MNTTSYQKPVLALDVDGVLNAFAPIRPHVTRQIGGRTVKGVFQPYTLRFDNEVVDMIEALQEHFDICWFTMWNERANDQIAPALGIDTFPVWQADHNKGWDTALDRGTEQWNIHRLWYAKTPLLPEYAQGRPTAWCDDDHSGADVLWLAKQDDAPEHFYLHQTDAGHGIQWSDVADLIQWADDLAAGSLVSMRSFHSAREAAQVFIEDPEPVLWFADDEMESFDWDSDEARAFMAAMDNEEM